MNTHWSTYVQRIGTLYQSRSLRFSDRYKDACRQAFDIDGKARILEIGCGPGALCESLRRWYPEAAITGVDLDSAFIEFARSHIAGVDFAEEDATCLSFPDNSFDVTISNTVAEHIEPGAFFGEQYRVLEPGGVCLTLSVRRGVNIASSCVSEETAWEREIFARVQARMDEVHQAQKVCQYPMDEAELPRAMERAGFRNVSTAYLTMNLTPDNPCFTREEAVAMIESNRRNDLDFLSVLETAANDLVTQAELAELRRLTEERFNRRIALYDAGEKQWDVNLILLMVLRGVKLTSL